jgi:hypothetical protein
VLFKRGSTHNAVLVARIVKVLNQVNPITPGSVHSCPGRPDRNALQFGYTNGDRWTVYDDGCWDFFTHGERGTALGDPPVYTVIYRLIDLVAGVPVGRFNLSQSGSSDRVFRSHSVSVAKGPLHVAITSYNGLRLSVSVPQRAYPRNALIRVSVSLQNISHHTVVLGRTCYTPTLWGDVTNQAHTMEFSSYLPVRLTGGVATCIYTRPTPGPRLAPGQTLHKEPYLVLRGGIITATAIVDPERYAAYTPPLRVRLIPAKPSTIHVHLPAPTYAVLQPPPGAEGLPVVAEAYRCRRGPATTRGFHVVHTLYLVPHCAHVVEWHVIAGWLDHPVTTINYTPLPGSQNTRVRPHAYH